MVLKKLACIQKVTGLREDGQGEELLSVDNYLSIDYGNAVLTNISKHTRFKHTDLSIWDGHD